MVVCLVLEAIGNGTILDNNNDAILDNKALVDEIRVVHLILLVDQFHVLANARIFVHNALLQFPARARVPVSIHEQPEHL